MVSAVCIEFLFDVKASMLGNVVVLWIFREQMVVINSYAVASSLLEGPRSVQYADKPRVRMAEMWVFPRACCNRPY